MKILLIALYDYYSKGVRGLHSFLDEKGHDVSSFYFKESTYTDGLYKIEEFKALIATVKKLEPDYVGISVRSPLFILFTDICRNLRKYCPDVKIIAGGSHATADPESCLKHADYVIPGDGEYPLLDILNGDYFETIAKRKPFNDLDSLPFPHYGENTYTICNPEKVEPKTSVYTTRGCFFNCSFCQESLWRRQPVRKSVKYWKEELAYLKTIFPGTIIWTISDSNFLFDMDWLEEFASEFSGSGMRFWCAGNAALINEEMLRVAKKAGVEAIRLGVQSASERIRKEVFNRRDTLEQILKVSKTISDLKMLGHYDFILENPYDDWRSIAANREFIRKLPEEAVTNKFELRYWPGTPLTEKALKDGYITEKDVEGNFLRFGQWAYVYQRMHPAGVN